jgi:ABC-type transport system involved in cytochrome c biogenesis permease subunit
MNPIWYLPAIICYGLAAASFALDRVDRVNRAGRGVGRGTALLIGGIAMQTAALAVSSIEAGTVPVTNFAQSLAFLAWLTALTGLGLILRFRMAVIGAYVAPIVAAVLAIAIVMMKQGRLAAAVSILYLVYEQRLKTKRPLMNADERAPSLEKLDRVNYLLLGWGFVMLSLAIVTGAIWADARWGHFWSWEPQESWSLVIWVLYAALLESRLTVGWRGHRAATLTIAVFTVLVGSFVGVSLVNPGKHGGTFG